MFRSELITTHSDSAGAAISKGAARMRRAALALLAAALISACNVGETERLRERVGELERQLAAANSELTARDILLQALRDNATEHPASPDFDVLRNTIAEQQREIEAVTMKLVKTKVERDLLRQELAALRKRERSYAD